MASEEAGLSLAARDALREFQRKWVDLLSDLNSSKRNLSFSISAFERKAGMKLCFPLGKVKLKMLLEALRPKEGELRK